MWKFVATKTGPPLINCNMAKINKSSRFCDFVQCKCGIKKQQNKDMNTGELQTQGHNFINHIQNTTTVVPPMKGHPVGVLKGVLH